MDTIQILTLATLAGHWQAEADRLHAALPGTPTAARKETLRECADVLRGLCETRFEDLPRGGIVGSVEIVACVTDSTSPWFVGKYGFMLRDPQPLPFTPWKGQLGFFDVPESALSQPAEQAA